ncbi:MAG: hypothetical protein HZA51_17265 [Planctomycetes bacterium]|nr:hypothetical protein [Planctomycetota bacterium]
MRWYRRKWMLMAAMSMGTVLQLSTCREETALLGLRTAFSAFTLPVNIFIRSFILGIS